MSQNLISAFSVILNTEFVITLFLYLGVILLTEQKPKQIIYLLQKF